MTQAVLELVVAVAQNDVIGRANTLPWHLPADLRHFKELTTGKSVLMGRKTYESIGRALPNRTNLVLSRTPGFAPIGCRVVASVQDAVDTADTSMPLMIIGGAEVYRQCLPIANRLHLTLVHTSVPDGDTFFPDWRAPDWVMRAREDHPPDPKNAYAYSFITLDKQTRPAAVRG